MKALNRRNFLSVAASGAAASFVAAVPFEAHATTKADGPTFTNLREETEAALRSIYRAKNNLDLNGYLASFADDVVYQDATLGLSIPGLKNITPLFTGLFQSVGTAGRLSEYNFGIGDMSSGAVAEFVDLPKSFANTAYDALSILCIRDGKIVRNTDYWDSAQLSESDAYGPASKAGIAFPAVPVHEKGPSDPRSAAAFGTGTAGSAYATPDLVKFVTHFHGELAKGNAAGVAKLFTDDAVLIHPLLHTGPLGYGPFNRTIQVRGADNIQRILKAALPAVPDGANSQLLQIVGGSAGGGYEWRAGGTYSTKGFDRKGILGATSIDIFRNRIRRLSVKFDTLQMGSTARDSVRQLMASASPDRST